MAEVETKATLDRINLQYETKVGDQTQSIELPFRLLVLGDFTLDDRSDIFEEQETIVLNSDNALNVLFKQLKPRLDLKLSNKLLDDDSQIALQFSFNSIDDFSPANLVKNNEILQDIALCIQALSNVDDESVALPSGQNIIEQMLKIEGISIQDIEQKTDNFGWLVAEFEQRLCAQLDAILHHSQFHQMEALWRSMNFLIDQTDFSENTEIVTLNVSKQALIDDFDDVPEITHSLYYQIVYSHEFGQFGGRPYGAIIANYSFDPKSPDIKCLQRLANVSAISHAPFIAAASAEFFDIEKFSDFSRLRDLDAIFGQPSFIKWNAFRESEDARYVSLTLPSFLLRETYNLEIDNFNYKEKVRDKDTELLWGNASFAYGTRLISSFANYRWCLNSTGKEGGLVQGLKMKNNKIQTQIIITDRKESDVVAQGFMPLSVHKGDDSAAFYSAYSAYKINESGEDGGNLAARLSAQLPYLFIICRFSQYLKVMQRENIGSWRNRRDLDQQLNKWLSQYVSDMDNPAAGVRARRPLRRAEVKVREVDGKQDWFVTQIQITPHLKFMGNSFNLTDVSKMEKN